MNQFYYFTSFIIAFSDQRLKTKGWNKIRHLVSYLLLHYIVKFEC